MTNANERAGAGAAATPTDVPASVVRLANVVLAAGAALFAVLGAAMLYAFREALPDALALGLAAIPLLLAVLLLAARRLRPAARAGAALALVFAVLGLYLVEIGLSFVPPREINDVRADLAKEATAKRGAPFDPRPYVDVVSAYRAQGKDAFSATTIAELQIVARVLRPPLLPLAGVSDRPHVLCRESGVYPVYQSDEHGFNNPQGIWGGDSLQVAIIGDSFAHGFCVEPDSNFTAVIRKRFPATLTLGMVGAGPIREMAALREYLPPLKPKVVLWFYFEGNDLRDMENERQVPTLRRYLEDDSFTQGLAARQPTVDSVVRAFFDSTTAVHATRGKRAPRGPSLLGRLRRVATFASVRGVLDTPVREALGLPLRGAGEGDGAAGRCCDLRTFTGIMRRVKATVGGWGGRVVFVYVPSYNRYGGPGLRPKQMRVRDDVLGIARDLGMPIVDLDAEFRARGDPRSFYYYVDTHLNPAGQRAAGEAVLKALR